MRLTIGTATYDDYTGLWPTLQALRLYHADALRGREVELVVVDNAPPSEHGAAVRKLMGHLDLPHQYHPLEKPQGTAAPRDLIFRHARGDFVLVVDCHVLLWPGSVRRLLDWADSNRNGNDLVSGPLVYDNLQQVSTHFADEWRGEMWGTWAHDPRGDDPNGPPFEIPAMGLGLFGCRKDAWVGFNPAFRGFGGEEWYVHEKVRKAGAKCLCLPFLRWVHRFDRPGGPPYVPSLWNKVRNYVIGHTELGLPLDRVEAHFRHLMHPSWWEALTANPANPPEHEPGQGPTPPDPTAFLRQQLGISPPVAVRPPRPAHPKVRPARRVGLPPPPGKGPGTELKALLESIGVTSQPNCACRKRMEEMNRMGVAGVKARRDEVAGWLRNGSAGWSWAAKVFAGVRAVASGLAFKLDPADPFPGLVDEAVRRAEEKEAVK